MGVNREERNTSGVTVKRTGGGVIAPQGLFSLNNLVTVTNHNFMPLLETAIG